MSLFTKPVADIECCLNSLTTRVEGLENTVVDEVTLVAGVGEVAETRVTSSSRVQFSRHTVAGTLGHLGYDLDPGVGIIITSTSASETSVISFIIYL